MTYTIELICPECNADVGFDFEEVVQKEIHTINCQECKEPIELLQDGYTSWSGCE